MFKSNCTFLFFTLIFLLVGGKTAAGQELGPLVLTADQNQHPLGLHLAILEDQEGTLTIDDVMSTDLASQFVPSQKPVPGAGFTESAYWVRFSVRNETQSAEWLVSC